MKDMRKLLDGQVFAMLPSALEAYGQALAAVDVDALPAAAADPAAVAGAPGQAGAVAVIPVYGMIQQRRDVWMAMFGGTSMVGLSNAFRAAMEDPGVKAIVLDFHTPGGPVYGVPEAARQIRAARGTKPIVAMVNSLAASAGYWLASAADEIVAQPSSECGSIGCFIVHVNEGKAAEAQGYEVTLFSAGDLKPAESGVASLTDEQRASIQARVDNFYNMLVSDIAKGRGVATETVRKGYGRGGILGATAAKDAGLVDRVATLEETVARLGSPSGRRASMTTGQQAKTRMAEISAAAGWTLEPDELRPAVLEEETPAAVATDDVDVRRRRLALSMSE